MPLFRSLLVLNPNIVTKKGAYISEEMSPFGNLNEKGKTRKIFFKKKDKKDKKESQAKTNPYYSGV